MAWGLFEPPMVVLGMVFVVGSTAKGVIGTLLVLGWAIPVVLSVFVEEEVGSGGEFMSAMASQT